MPRPLNLLPEEKIVRLILSYRRQVRSIDNSMGKKMLLSQLGRLEQELERRSSPPGVAPAESAVPAGTTPG
jgi:hypothetical protein